MKQIDRLIIKATRISAGQGEEVILVSFSGGEWASGGRCFQSLEAAERFFLENAKADPLFIVNDLDAGGPHPLWAAVTRQKARYRRREKLRSRLAEKERLKVEMLKRLKRAEELEQDRENARQEQERRCKEVGRVI